jgi:hypothetical protein
MHSKSKNIISIVCSLVFTVLFFKNSLGLNLFITELILLFWIIKTKQLKLQTFNTILTFSGVLVSSIATIITHSVLSYFVNFIALFILTGILIYPKIKSFINAIQLAVVNLFKSQVSFINALSNSNSKKKNAGFKFKKVSVFIIPIVIIFVFIVLYKNSNPVFNNLVNETLTSFGNFISNFFELINLSFLLTFILLLFICNLFLFKTKNENIIKSDFEATFLLQRIRIRKIRFFKLNDLKNEYKAGIFLLINLNLLILIVNIIDIKWVWFNFEWEGQFLKQFVHEGTYLLILSILISIGLVLYFFRKNLNFYQQNKILKYLSYSWLFQNGILTISVAIRNFYYIDYFSLAYKRIGVILFLLLTLYGLYTVFVKVKDKKTSFYLFQTNFSVLFIVLIISSIVNWDKVIVNYNFKNANKSFLELNYLVDFSDKTLPYLDKSLSELNQIHEVQTEKFPFSRNYMSPEKYHSIIQKRKITFQKEWEEKGILSWNLPEYLAYEKIKTSSLDK